MEREFTVYWLDCAIRIQIMGLKTTTKLMVVTKRAVNTLLRSSLLPINQAP